MLKKEKEELQDELDSAKNVIKHRHESLQNQIQSKEQLHNQLDQKVLDRDKEITRLMKEMVLPTTNSSQLR